VQTTVMNMSVCLYVCLIAYPENDIAELYQIFVHVACGRAILYVLPVL